MKKLPPIVLAFAAIVALTPCGPVTQSFAKQSEVGLYADPADLSSNTASVGAATITLYLVLTNPVLDDGLGSGTEPAVPVQNVTAFDCRVELPDGFLLIAAVLPVQGIIIGTLPNLYVGYREPILVIDGQATLASLVIFGSPVDDGACYLVPPSQSPEIPGHMAAVERGSGNNGTSFIMHPVSGGHDLPVFTFNPTNIELLSIESIVWGGVKALYR